MLKPGDDMLLLLVLDLSGDLTLIGAARSALLAQLEALPENVRVGLLRTQDDLRVLSDPAEPREALASSIEALSVSPRPALLSSLESIEELADSVSAKAHVRVATLFVSDSNVANYREDYTNPVVNSSDSGDMSRRFPEGLIQERIRQLSASRGKGENPMYLVHLQYLGDRLNTAYQTGLIDLFRATGGSSEFCRSISEIPSSLEKTMAAVLSQYSVEVEWPTPRTRQVDVVVEAGDREIHFRPRRSLPKTKAKKEQ